MSRGDRRAGLTGGTALADYLVATLVVQVREAAAATSCAISAINHKRCRVPMHVRHESTAENAPATRQTPPYPRVQRAAENNRNE